MKKASLLLLAASLSALGQQPLTLKDAVRAALGQHPSMEAASARIRAAEARIEQARSGWLPQVRYQETVQGGNNPIYVFGAKLTQRQFTMNDFSINSLNRPDPLQNFQSLVTAQQNVYDFGRTRKSEQVAKIGREMTAEEKRQAELGLIYGVARAYHGVTLAIEAQKTADESVKAAEADLQRAQAIRTAGMATEADVLSIQVHLSAMQEQSIRRRYDLEIARAALNEALGRPLDAPLDLVTPLTTPATDTQLQRETAEAEAKDQRPEARITRLASDMAQTQTDLARKQYLPQFFVRGAFEADRRNFVNNGGANWMASAGLEWNLFDGFRTRGQVKEAASQTAAAAAEHRRVQSALQLQARQAWSGLKASEERVKSTETVISQAEESLRIVRNRYANGLTNVTELIRTQTALLDARMRKLQAIYDQRMAAIALEQAAGSLSGESNVLN